ADLARGDVRRPAQPGGGRGAAGEGVRGHLPRRTGSTHGGSAGGRSTGAVQHTGVPGKGTTAPERTRRPGGRDRGGAGRDLGGYRAGDPPVLLLASDSHRVHARWPVAAPHVEPLRAELAPLV